jgi:hypothetical protein
MVAMLFRAMKFQYLILACQFRKSEADKSAASVW